jgi:hypothetical protein
MPDAPPCQRQQELMEKVQYHLIRIADLSRATAEAVANQNENLVRELDKQVESELGSKERALGALREHRREHGC